MESKTNKSEEIKGIVFEGVEYVNQVMAAKMAGVTIPTFKRKVALFRIEGHKLRDNSKKFYIKSDIQTAIENGLFNKWWM